VQAQPSNVAGLRRFRAQFEENDQSIRVTIEHGHANRRSDDLSSTAYWYQHEPHRPFPALPPVEARLPRPG